LIISQKYTGSNQKLSILQEQAWVSRTPFNLNVRVWMNYVKFTERAKQTSSAPERMKLSASLTAPVVHIKPTGSAPERARLVTSSSSAPTVGIRTLADLKREKEEKLRRDKTESKNESSMLPRKRCHAGLELYKPPSVLRKGIVLSCDVASVSRIIMRCSFCITLQTFFFILPNY